MSVAISDLIMRHGTHGRMPGQEQSWTKSPTYGPAARPDIDFVCDHVLHQCKLCGEEFMTPIRPGGSWDERAAAGHTCSA
jgi:hypothetical protein